MTTKFGFQVTVEERTIWIFPEDIDAATVATQAEAKLKKTIAKELAKTINNQDELDKLIKRLPDASRIQSAIEVLPSDTKIEDTVAVLVSLVSLADIKEQINGIEGAAKTEINRLKAQATTGVIYRWTRGLGEDPISLGVFRDLTKFIDRSIIGSLPSSVRPSFSVDDEFSALVSGLPDPVNGALTALTTKAVFELDSIRLKIPGKSSVDEKIQFEIAMLINLVALDLILGPFQLNRLYAKFGNFGSIATTSA
ncbi:MAG: hypothetical protein EA343_08265 [Nodularia sp. (in: Bacteria)]|nr:MAG: hypothetical protein EA343_08265 [Nodularia sp. (in: cyanobacteria)]